MTELLLGTPLSAEQREYAEAAMKSASALMLVLNDMIDFSKIEAGTLELDIGTFEVRSLIESLAAVAGTEAAEKGVEVVCSIDDSVPWAVSGDGNRIREMLSKLVGSALDLTNLGRVSIRVSGAPRNTDSLLLRFEVSDTGSGMGDDALLRAFNPYAQGDDSSALGDGGSGLGLAICKRLAELMGGEFGGASAPGAGSTFWFTTPVGIAAAAGEGTDEIRARREPKPVARVKMKPRRSASKTGDEAVSVGRILVAEDDPISQLVMTRQLELRGFAVDVASNGREAVEMHSVGGYSAIFMDCQLPELSGYEATAEIRGHEGDGPRTPIIAMTASVHEGVREQCWMSGMDDYISKPVDQAALDAAIARRLAGGAGADGTASDRQVAGDPELPLLERSVLTDVFRHNSESRSYLIGVFIDESRSRIDQLEAATETADTAAMQQLSHALQGSASAVGARRLAHICGSMHDAVIAGRPNEVMRLRASLERCFELTSELLQRGCPQVLDGALAHR
jgi:CheY-like chemotaxis protein